MIAQEIGPAPDVPIPPDAAWGEVFRPFSELHAISVLACALVTLLVIVMGRSWRGTVRELFLRRMIGAFIVVAQAASIWYWLLPANYAVGNSYPLHLCDVAAWAAAVAMLTEWRWARTLVFFLGLALSTQGFITPVVRFGYESPRFWFFWIGHTQIVGSALYFFIVSRYRPSARDFLIAVGATFAWLCIVFPLNIVIDTNYGYVGPSSPSTPTIVDKLGPWPWRVLIMIAMALAGFTGVWMIGAGIARFEGRRGGAGADARAREAAGEA